MLRQARAKQRAARAKDAAISAGHDDPATASGVDDASTSRVRAKGQLVQRSKVEPCSDTSVPFPSHNLHEWFEM